MDEGEFGLIREIGRIAGDAPPTVTVGIGDDCAAISHRRGETSIYTTDCLVEGVHFRREGRTPRDIGWKAVAVNLSDIASMGGRPVAFLLTLVIPESASREFILELVRGAVACGRRYGAGLIGGNISSASGDGLVVDISMIGAVSNARMLRRAGARQGEIIYVAGWPGRSFCGLSILNAGARGPALKYPGLVKAHLRPEPMLKAGMALTARGLATSMIDTSDGLVQDLGHICESSGVGAEIDPTLVPLSSELKRYCRESGKNTHEAALSGGEDYGLVFTVKKRNASRVAGLSMDLGLKVTAIGTIVRGRGVKVRGGAGREFKGYDHFTPQAPGRRRP